MIDPHAPALIAMLFFAGIGVLATSKNRARDAIILGIIASIVFAMEGAR